MNEGVKKWLLKAFEDLKVIEHEISFPENEIPTSAVCFHCQQFVEKVLKAYLSLKGVDFGKTHNLEFLLELCKKEDKEFERLDLGNLTFYAVEVRYPDEFYVPSIEETREAVKIVNETRQFIEHKLNLRLENLRKRR